MIHDKSKSVPCSIALERGETFIEEKQPYYCIYLDGKEIQVPAHVYREIEEIFKEKIK